MSEAFQGDAWTMMLFFRACRRYKIERRDARIALLRELVKRKKVKYIRDVEPVLAGKKVLVVREPKKEQN